MSTRSGCVRDDVNGRIGPRVAVARISSMRIRGAALANNAGSTTVAPPSVMNQEPVEPRGGRRCELASLQAVGVVVTCNERGGLRGRDLVELAPIQPRICTCSYRRVASATMDVT